MSLVRFGVGANISGTALCLWQFEKISQRKIICFPVQELSPSEISRAVEAATTCVGEAIPFIPDLPPEYKRAWNSTYSEAKKAHKHASLCIRKSSEKIHKANNTLSSIKRKIVPFGQHQGKTFDEVPIGYVNWLSDVAPDVETEFMKLLAKELTEHRKHDILPKPSQNFLGTIDEPIVCDGVVTKSSTYNSKYGECTYTRIVERETRAVVVVKSAKFCPPVGTYVKIRGIVSAHDRHEGQNQTILTRVKQLICYP